MYREVLQPCPQGGQQQRTYCAVATAPGGEAAAELHGVALLAQYPPLQRLQQKRLSARRHNTTYCYDFPAVFESALRWAAGAGGMRAVWPCACSSCGASWWQVPVELCRAPGLHLGHLAWLLLGRCMHNTPCALCPLALCCYLGDTTQGLTAHTSPCRHPMQGHLGSTGSGRGAQRCPPCRAAGGRCGAGGAPGGLLQAAGLARGGAAAYGPQRRGHGGVAADAQDARVPPGGLSALSRLWDAWMHCMWMRCIWMVQAVNGEWMEAVSRDVGSWHLDAAHDPVLLPHPNHPPTHPCPTPGRQAVLPKPQAAAPPGTHPDHTAATTITLPAGPPVGSHLQRHHTPVRRLWPP